MIGTRRGQAGRPHKGGLGQHTIAVLAWVLTMTGIVHAGPGPCVVDATGTIATCTGDQSGGIRNSASPSPRPGEDFGSLVTTLNVNSLTANINPGDFGDGIDFINYYLRNTGNMTLNIDTGQFQILSVRGGAHAGIVATSTGGAITVNSHANISGLFGNVDGIAVINSAPGSPVLVNSWGDITVQGIAPNGVNVDSIGAVTINSFGNISTTSTSGPATAISVGDKTTTATVTNFGNISVTSSVADSHGTLADNYGIRVGASAGATVINYGTVNAGTLQGASVGFIGGSFNGGSFNQLVNYGTITPAAGVAGNAILWAPCYSGAPSCYAPVTSITSVTNFGMVTGTVDLGSGPNVFANGLGATFNMGSRVFLGDVGVLTNFGLLAPGGASTIMTTQLTGSFQQSGPGVLAIKLNPGAAASDQLLISGIADLGGTLRLILLGAAPRFGSSYTVLSAGRGLLGTFDTIDRSGLGAGVIARVSYTPTDVLVALGPQALAPSLPPGTPRNAASVAAGLDRSVFQFGADPTPLFNLYNLPAGQLPAGLASLSGEVHTSVAAMGVDEANGFLRVMLDPFAVGRAPGANPTLAYADSAIVNPALGATDQAADLAGPAPFDARRFAVWGAAFGSTGHTDGDGTIGSSRRQLSDANLAVGVDVRLDPQTVVGFAAAGGGAHASLDNGLGSASADVWQIGAYVLRRDGPWSLGAAMAYSWLGVDTTRQVFVLAVPSLNAHTTAHGFSGRIEGAYEVGQWSGLAVAPFAAFEGHAVHAPGFLETNLVGAPIGLAGSSHTNTTTRTELGVKLDGKAVWGGMDVTSFAKLAWAHYFDRDALLNASLIGFAGSNFTVLGARPDRDSALLSAGLDVKLTPLISLGGRIDGELSGNVAQVSGSARLRVSF